MSAKQDPAPIPADKLSFEGDEAKPKDWFEVIDPPTNLKQKAVLKGIVDQPIDMEALKRAEEALEDLSANFNNWMHEEVASLVKAAENVRGQKNEETLEELYHASHNVKGQAHTLGFPLAGLAAASLCRLIETLPEKQRLPMELVDNHIKTVAAIVREDVRDMENKLGCALIDRLEDVTDDYLKQELAKAEQV